MNLWTLRCGCRFGEARERDATNPSRPLFQFQRFPTRVTLHDEIVVGERWLSVMGLWLKVADQNLLEADFTRVLSDCAYINRDDPHSSHCCCTPTYMSSRPKDQGNRRPPVQRSNIGDPKIPSTKGLTPGRVGEPPALIAYVIYLPYSV